MSRPSSPYADVLPRDQVCSWRGCRKRSIWDVSEHRINSNGNWVPYCGEHTRAALRGIEALRAARQATRGAEGVRE